MVTGSTSDLITVDLLPVELFGCEDPVTQVELERSVATDLAGSVPVTAEIATTPEFSAWLDELNLTMQSAHPGRPPIRTWTVPATANAALTALVNALWHSGLMRVLADRALLVEIESAEQDDYSEEIDELTTRALVHLAEVRTTLAG